MSENIKFRIKSLLVILVLVSACFSQARQFPRRPTPVRRSAAFLQQVKFYEETPYVTKVVLKNGMKVLVNEYGAQPVVSVQVHVDAGFAEEPSQSPGLASLLAAMVYRGTSNKSQGTFRQRIQALGGLFRSFADYDHTRFEVVAPSSQWKKALASQAEVLLNPSLDQDELRLVSSLVLGDARAALDHPSEFASEKLLELGFNQRRMGKYDTIAGGSLRNIQQESLIAFYKAMYTPARVTLVVSGDVRSSEVLDEVARIYGDFSGLVTKHASLPLETRQNEFRYRAIRGDIPIPIVLFGFHTASANEKDYRALEVMSAILGLGEGSVLASRLRDQKGLIFAGKTKMTAYSDLGYLSIQIEVDPQNIDRSEIAALTEFELMKREEPSEADMERAFAQLERLHWKRLETVTERARILARHESLGDWKRMDRYLSELREVKSSEVKRVANKYLRLQNCSLLEYLPASMEPRNLTVEGVRRTLEGLSAPSADQEKAERAKEVIPAVKLPPRSGRFTFSEMRYPFQTASILRGPDLFIREDHTAPLIELGLFFPGGRLAENKENAGITELMTRLILGGTQNGRVIQFYRQLEIYGGQVQRVITEDYFGFYLSILSRNFAAGFDLLQEAIKTPAFDRDEIGRQKGIQTAEMLRQRNSVSYPRRLMTQALFEGFSYSLDRYGTASSLAGITPDSLQSWYDAYIKNRKPVAAAIGDTKGTSLAANFVQHFSGSRFRDTEISEEFVKPLEKVESIEKKWSKNQSLILVGFQAPPMDDEDGHAVTVLQSYAGSMGLLSQEIQDRLGTAYRTSLTYEPRLHGGSMIACAATYPGGEDAVLKALRETIQKVTADPIVYRDFRSALNEAVGARAIRYQTRSMQIADLAETILAGEGIEGFQNFASGIQEVKEEDLKSAAQRIFRMDKAVILVIYGQSK